MKEDKTPTMIGFFHEDEEYGCFSNWYRAEFDYAGRHFLHIEQFMMFHKVMMFRKFDLADQIMATSDPQECKKIARQKFPEFNADLWDQVGTAIVKRGVRAKFIQNEAILHTLLGTGNLLLAECSPYDPKWGIGIDIKDPERNIIASWKGKNLLGRILMEVREELRQELIASSNGKLEYIDAYDLEPIPEWNMTAGELKRIPQFYKAIHAYSDTLQGNYERSVFYNEYSLYQWEIAMRTNMGGGLPVIGFYEMKQDVYDTVRRLLALDIQRQKRLAFCDKYIPILEMIEKDDDLRSACESYSVYAPHDNQKHPVLIDYLYDEFMKEAYEVAAVHNYSEVISGDYVWKANKTFLETLSIEEVLACITWHLRADHWNNGTLISNSIARGQMLLLLRVLADKEKAAL